MTSKDCSILINGHQLREALSFLAPDNTEEQLDQEVVISTGGAECHSGPGLYCWLDEYPEEGAIKLDGTSPAALSAPPASVPAELTNVRCMCGDEYPHDSYGAGFIAGSGMCENCAAAQGAMRDADRKAMDDLKAMSFEELMELSEGTAPPAAGVPEGWRELPHEASDALQVGQKPFLHINPFVVDEIEGRRKASPGGLTWSREACGHWTFPLYTTPPASEQQRAVVMPEGLREAMGKAASSWLYENDPQGLDWCDPCNVDALLDALFEAVPHLQLAKAEDKSHG
ncbi:hypothetical protein [Metapseudomonas otitidis]|uniref:hypothetical protein n=1 Tax=Metapseudomonas otitidis TaxID=319939 RepID=UPI001F104902|nr:hypothetical protein [Pseudomonas otitidis]